MKSALDILTTALTPDYPFSRPFAAEWSSGAFFLAQASGIESVPADFVKNFLIMFGFVTIGAGAYLFGRRGSRGNPLHVEQPVSVDASVTHAPVYVHQSTVDALKQDIERRTRENLRQHEEHAERHREIISTGHERQTAILKALSEMEQRMTSATLKELKDIHDRLNPMGERVAEHREALKNMKESLNQLWELVKPLLGMKTKPRP